MYYTGLLIYDIINVSLRITCSKGFSTKSTGYNTNCIGAVTRSNQIWMDELGFYVPSTVFQLFRDDGRVNMKGSVQWSAV